MLKISLHCLIRSLTDLGMSIKIIKISKIEEYECLAIFSTSDDRCQGTFLCVTPFLDRHKELIEQVLKSKAPIVAMYDMKRFQLIAGRQSLWDQLSAYKQKILQKKVGNESKDVHTPV